MLRYKFDKQAFNTPKTSPTYQEFAIFWTTGGIFLKLKAFNSMLAAQ
jgi:hypothetical protein